MVPKILAPVVMRCDEVWLGQGRRRTYDCEAQYEDRETGDVDGCAIARKFDEEVGYYARVRAGCERDDHGCEADLYRAVSH